MPSQSEMSSAVRSRLAERFKREDSALKIKLGIFNTPHDLLKEVGETDDVGAEGYGGGDDGATANQGVFGRGAAGLGGMAQRGDPFSSLLEIKASAGGITAADDMSEAGLTTNVGCTPSRAFTPSKPVPPPPTPFTPGHSTTHLMSSSTTQSSWSSLTTHMDGKSAPSLEPG